MDFENHGWKTYLAAAAAIIGGITMILANDPPEYEAGFASIVAGLALIGIRGAVAKVIVLLQQILSKRT